MAYSTLTKMQFLNTRIELVTKFIQHDSRADEDKVYSRFNDNNHISVLFYVYIDKEISKILISILGRRNKRKVFN